MKHLLLILAAALAALLVSCADYPLTGSIAYRHPGSGAKGGLEFIPGQRPGGFVKIPIRDPETGEITGHAELATAPPVVEPAK